MQLGQFPAVVLNKKDQNVGVAILVESISISLGFYNHTTQIEGTPFCCFRKNCVDVEKEVCLWIIKRRGTLSMEPDSDSSYTLLQIYKALRI